MIKAPLAQCLSCPLRDQPFCPPVPHAPAQYVIVGESPGRVEIREGRPFVGPSGLLLNNALRRAELARTSAYITNAVLCLPPFDMPAKAWGSAIAACRPRLEADLAPYKGLPTMTLGGRALHAMAGRPYGIMDWFGYPFHGVFPIFHPASVLRKPQFGHLFNALVQRFAQWMAGGAHADPYVWPQISIQEDVHALQALYSMQRAPCVAVDVETAGKCPMFNTLLCVGVSDGAQAVTLWWPPTSAEHMDALRALLANPRVEKVFHNLQHDVLALRAARVELRGALHDSLLAHTVLYPLLPHRLSFVAAQAFCAPRWKSAFHDESELKGAALFAHSDAATLKTYNARDNIMTQRIDAPLRSAISKRPWARRIYDELLKLSDIAMEMRQGGVCLDRAVLEKHRELLTFRMDATRKEFTEATVAYPFVNLGKTGTHPSLKKLFFDTWHIPPKHTSKLTHKPSLDSWSLAMYRTFSGEVGKVADLAYRYRKDGKLLSTYVEGMGPLVGPDGRLHPAWQVWAAISGRWSCAIPNMMNIPKKMRDVICAAPGHVFVAADYDKLELRIVAILADDRALLKAFDSGADVHMLNAIDLFGPGATKAQRDLAKRFVYGANYGGSYETLWENLVPEFPTLAVSHVAMLLQKWKHAHPRIFGWHEHLWREAEQKRAIIIPGSGRQIPFYGIKQGGDSANELNRAVNLPVQGTAAHLANRAVLSLVPRIVGIGRLVVQCHDELVIEVPERHLVDGARILKEAMETPLLLGEKDWAFPVDLKMGKSWGVLEKVTT